MQAVLGEGEVKGFGHLTLRLAPGACPGHCQRDGDAERGVEEIAVLFLLQRAVQVKGETVVAVDQFGQVLGRDIGPGHPRCIRPDNLNMAVFWTDTTRDQAQQEKGID
jgi:hypothetical protein